MIHQIVSFAKGQLGIPPLQNLADSLGLGVFLPRQAQQPPPRPIHPLQAGHPSPDELLAVLPVPAPPPGRPCRGSGAAAARIPASAPPLPIPKRPKLPLHLPTTAPYTPPPTAILCPWEGRGAPQKRAAALLQQPLEGPVRRPATVSRRRLCFYWFSTARSRASVRLVFSHGTPKSSRPMWP